jgi:hypothetical protein
MMKQKNIFKKIIDGVLLAIATTVLASLIVAGFGYLFAATSPMTFSNIDFNTISTGIIIFSTGQFFGYLMR